jgi:hypothetical protein
MLFVGEAPPASGRFFIGQIQDYIGLFVTHSSVLYPNVGEGGLFKSFQSQGCYLVDLCGRPVDRLERDQRNIACVDGEVRLARILRQLRPEIVITVVRSISANVTRAERWANWKGRHIELPYPGRWHRHRAVFLKTLTSLLREDQAMKSCSAGGRIIRITKNHAALLNVSLRISRLTSHPRLGVKIERSGAEVCAIRVTRRGGTKQTSESAKTRRRKPGAPHQRRITSGVAVSRDYLFRA